MIPRLTVTRWERGEELGLVSASAHPVAIWQVRSTRPGWTQMLGPAAWIWPGQFPEPRPEPIVCSPWTVANVHQLTRIPMTQYDSAGERILIHHFEDRT